MKLTMVSWAVMTRGTTLFLLNTPYSSVWVTSFRHVQQMSHSCLSQHLQKGYKSLFAKTSQWHLMKMYIRYVFIYIWLYSIHVFRLSCINGNMEWNNVHVIVSQWCIRLLEEHKSTANEAYRAGRLKVNPHGRYVLTCLSLTCLPEQMQHVSISSKSCMCDRFRAPTFFFFLFLDYIIINKNKTYRQMYPLFRKNKTVEFLNNFNFFSQPGEDQRLYQREFSLSTTLPLHPFRNASLYWTLIVDLSLEIYYLLRIKKH